MDKTNSAVATSILFSSQQIQEDSCSKVMHMIISVEELLILILYYFKMVMQRCSGKPIRIRL